ncbi:DUF397 domain-containing protein [Nocardiopsis gilva YIM 90087]|uniref:DUF397 domain-containing protein n=1 Tax=Nocardiopsis gilva YIM 90087 TaxID=1235441 RepID=A0A223S0F7_9ACTN|nr:DUF397 domain-containing protein [Nocardiopsis gilva]ASU81588.1 DUF397 domain-containing protein [Nocardiopsis gilva YIM 90087]
MREPHMVFRKSSYSGARTQDCVEVADLPGGAAVRDTQNRRLGHLTFDAAEWRAFLTDVKRDRL